MPRVLGDEGDYKNVIRLTVSCHPPAFQDAITIGVLRSALARGACRLACRNSGETGDARHHDAAVTRM